jgi:predicted Zn-dependent protease
VSAPHGPHASDIMAALASAAGSRELEIFLDHGFQVFVQADTHEPETHRAESLSGISVYRVDSDPTLEAVSEAAAVTPDSLATHISALAGKLGGQPARYAPAPSEPAARPTRADLSSVTERLRGALDLVPARWRARVTLDWVERTTYVARPGICHGKDQSWASVVVYVGRPEDRFHLARMSRIGVADSIDWFAGTVIADLLSAAVSEAAALADLPAPPPGVYDIRFKAAAASTVIHECVGHLLERDNALLMAGTPFVKLGAPMGNDLLSVVHDGTPRHPWGAVIDDEGEQTVREFLVNRGRVQRNLCTRRDGSADKPPCGGHARRVSFRTPALARMSTLEVLPGTASAAVSGAHPRLTVTSVRSGMVDPRSGLCTIALAESFGEASKSRYHGGTIRILAPDALLRIEAVGSDSAYQGARCFKRNQVVMCGTVTPSIDFRRVEVM